MKELARLNLIPIFGIFLIVINISIFASGHEEQKAAKQLEKAKLAEIEQKIKAITENECIAKYVPALKVADDGSMYRIYLLMYPLFVPGSLDHVQVWTDSVCKSAKCILDNYGLIRNISVWAIRPIQISWEGMGGWVFYGATFYDRNADKYEFKSLKVK